MAANIPTALIDTTAAISSLVDQLSLLPTDPPSIYIDLEGVDLCRSGSISILTLLVKPSLATQLAYLVDIHTLGRSAFDTPGKNETTLKNILESSTITKVFFDVRNDSDALYAHFGIALRAIEDVQLMENASRETASKRLLSGLAKCIRLDTALNAESKIEWEIIKDRGERLWKPRRGGSMEIFNQRPLPDDIKAYCVGDVQHLPILRNLYHGKLDESWKEKVQNETESRIFFTHLPDYEPNGPDKAIGPWADEPTTVRALESGPERRFG